MNKLKFRVKADRDDSKLVKIVKEYVKLALLYGMDATDDEENEVFEEAIKYILDEQGAVDFWRNLDDCIEEEDAIVVEWE